MNPTSIRNLRKKLDKYVDQPLSDHDIERFMQNKASVIKYGYLKGVQSIDQVLEPYGVCFILYEWRKGYGHWCLLTKRNDESIEFFNPYGGLPDSELENVPHEVRRELGEDKAYLCDLLVASPYEITYNEFQFQKLDGKVKTCGRWCLIRAYLKEMDLYDFQKLFMDIYGDEIVSLLT
jgi:hypothetical protein